MFFKFYVGFADEERTMPQIVSQDLEEVVREMGGSGCIVEYEDHLCDIVQHGRNITLKIQLSTVKQLT